MPAGAILQYVGAEAPTGFLLCQGQALSRTTYAGLFSALGGESSPYGLGDGTTTFNVPNLQGRIPVGRDSTQSEFDALGEIGGTKTHTLTVAEMPSHQHESPFPSNPGGDSGGNFQEIFGSGRTASQTGQTSEIYNNDVNSGAEGNELHPLVSATGGGQAHNNLQPYIVLNYIVKT
jgi:microcystin-dependent protein